MYFTRQQRLGIFISFITSFVFASFLGFVSVHVEGTTCGLVDRNFKYFATLEGVEETLDEGSLLPSSFKIFNISSVSVTTTGSKDVRYIEAFLEESASSEDISGIEILRFRLIKSLIDYLGAVNSSVIEFIYELICFDGSQVKGTLLLDILDVNNNAPYFIFENNKSYIDWRSYQTNRTGFDYKFATFNVVDEDYLPENGAIRISSCQIDGQNCDSLLRVDLNYSEVNQLTTGQRYDGHLKLNGDFEQHLGLEANSSGSITIQLTVSDGKYKKTQEFSLEFVGMLDPETENNSAPNSLALILGIVGGASFLIIILISALGFAIRRVKEQKKNLDKLTEADIREFREGTSVLSTSSASTHRDSIVANALVFSKPYNNQFEISRDHLKIDETTTLGCGMFGTVMKGFVTMYDRKLPVAVKTVKKNAGVLYFKSLLTELKIMSFIGNHPNIVCLVGACTQNIRKRELFVAVELCTNGNFRDYLKDRRDYYENIVDEDGRLNFRRNSLESFHGTGKRRASYQMMTTLDLIRWVFQIANGMEFIASKKVIHGDLAARNILLDGNCVAKIADFGLSRRLIDYTAYNYTKKSQCPLPWKYMAPESLKDLQFSLKTDIWTFGVLLWETFTLGQKPFSVHTWDEKFVGKLESGLRLDPPKAAPKEMCDLMTDCWAIAPEDRPNFFEVKRRISQLLHKQGDYADMNEDKFGSLNSSRSSYGYGAIKKRPPERMTILPPSTPAIVERSDDAFIY